ncbi:two-component system OmpR family sensor kinase [Kineococcus xinjiangensis]|uniref:histidine kinase n=1 Tax=Kineococcus xinjiangensis TaxID=512762 RepID=A0A2S6IT50_9ACTN|nr:HAMP domain-containing sensor histidine kinase [Kineococcus xinjiangensis]PPK97408.1 two-component system OmpR family sensor kinase [Kineococcus xinjiangensis]
MSGVPLRALPAELRQRLAATPLRVRLPALVAALLLAAMTATGVASLHLLRSALEARVDERLVQSGPSIVRSVVLPGAAGDDQLLPSDFYVQFSTLDGQVVGAYQPQQPGGPVRPDLPPVTADLVERAGERPFTVGSAGDDGRWRVTAHLTTTGHAVAVALPLAEVERTVDAFRTIQLLVGAAVLVAGTALGAVAIHRAFRPLVQIEGTASAIAAGDLSQRVPGAAPATEVGRLSGALNEMLGHVERAFRARQRSEEQMRRFVADASHELRTPLAAIRGFAELHRMGALQQPEDVARAMERIEAESTRLGGLVEDLLALARLEEAQRRRSAPREPVDLAVLASDAVHDARALAPERGVRLVGLPEGAPVRPTVVAGDDAALRQVLTNLVANALHHTPEGTPVEVAVGPVQGPSGPEAVVEVRDHGPGVPEEDAARVFERFYRVDASRRRGTGGGSGLGLAIAATIVEGHAGTVAVTATPGGGATFRLRFRLAPPAGTPTS